jgi:hypothetical protein
MRLKWPLLLGLVALMLGVPSANARSPFHVIGEGSVSTDGKRYALLRDRENAPYRVIDDRLHRSWAIASPPPGCSDVAGVADGSLLWHCPTLAGMQNPSSRPVLQNLETGEVTPVPGWDAYLNWFDTRAATGWMGQGPWPEDLGSRWLRASVNCYHCGPEYSYIDWHTGRLVPYLPDVATVVPDLDASDLQARLCAPLRRHAVDAPFGQSLEDADYEPPWLLRGSAGRYVQLYRCGHRKPLRIHRCSGLSSCFPQLGGGFLTWSDPSWHRVIPIVKVFRLADRRRVSIGKLKGARGLQHTRRTVYVNAASGKVYAAPIPRRRHRRSS